MPIPTPAEQVKSLSPEQKRRLFQKYMRTGRLSAISMNLHLDASGCDDWSDRSDPWYILVCVVTRSSHRWKTYVQWHDQLPGGRLHLSERAGRKKADRYSQAHTAISFDAGEYVFAQVVHRSTFCSYFSETPPERPSGQPESHWRAEFLWTSFLGVVISVVRNDDGAATIGSHPISKIVVNNPGRGRAAERALIEPLTAWIHAPPTVAFVSGGHPGIDLADTYAWSIRRYLTHGSIEQFPFEVSLKHPRLAMQIGAAGRQIPCPTLADLKKHAVSLEPTACREKSAG